MTETRTPRPMLLRPPVAAGIGVVVLAAAVLAAGLVGRAPEPTRTATPAPALAQVAAPVAAAAVATPVAGAVKPSFDIVRVTPRGEAVIAGRAEPNAAVTVEENGKALGTAKADPQGQWVLVPAAPIAPGPGALTLFSRSGDSAPVKGDTQVAIVVPPATPAPLAGPAQTRAPAPAPLQAATPAPAQAPMVILTMPDAAPRVLQAPATSGLRLTLDVVDYDARGEIRFAGLAPPGGVVRVYIDNRPAGDATADAQGRWGLVPGIDVAAGDHQLRVDLVGGAGQVLARQELPFQRAVIAPAEAPAARVVVQPRQNLWRIARQSYGQGVRYTVIFEANRDQIRDPNLIYPGQVFALPPSTPASASTSR